MNAANDPTRGKQNAPKAVLRTRKTSPPTSRQPTVRVATLVKEEIRALPRNSFALAAVAIVLAFFAPLGALAYGGEGGIEDTLIFTWLVGELIVAVIVAARVAAVRRNRFVDSLYTTPLEQRTWLLAQTVVGVVLAIIVLAVQFPFFVVHTLWLGIPPELPVMLLAGLTMAAVAVAMGLFFGVAVGEASPIAAAGLAGATAFIAFVFMIVHGAFAIGPPTPTQQLFVRFTSLSPLALVMDAFHISIFDVVPADRWRPFVGLGAIIFGLGIAAWITYTRAQTPLGWDRKGSRILVAVFVALAVVTPIVTAEVTYEETDDDLDYFEPGEHTQVTFVPRGGAVHNESFTLAEAYDAPHLKHGTSADVDALVLLLVTERQTVRDVRIEVRGTDTVRIEHGGILHVPDGKEHARAPPGQGWDDTENVPPRPVYRVPVTLRLIKLEAMGESPAVVEVHTSFRADNEPLNSVARFTMDGEIAGGMLQLFVAGLILPTTAFTALIVRNRRTR